MPISGVRPRTTLAYEAEALAASEAELARFESKFTEGAPDECWLWRGSKNGNGYGAFAFRGSNRPAHRIAYLFAVGPIPAGLTLDHLCKRPMCVNPKHLDPCTAGENTLRGDGPTAKAKRASHCPEGHPYNAANTYVTKAGARQCRECVRRRARLYQRRRRAALGLTPRGPRIVDRLGQPA